MLLLARSEPLRMASGTSRALPTPTPTRPLPSPTTTSARKRKAPPALDHLGDAADVHDALCELFALAESSLVYLHKLLLIPLRHASSAHSAALA